MAATARRLRLATLEDMEDQQTLNQQSQYPQLSQERSRGKVNSLPRQHFSTAQVIYDLTGKWSVLKKLVFWTVYLPLFRFFDRRFKFFPPTRKEADGSYSWIAHQGCFLTEAEAQADAKRYPFGYVVSLPLGRSLKQESTTEDSTVYFANQNGHENEANEHAPPVAFDLAFAVEIEKTRTAVRMMANVM